MDFVVNGFRPFSVLFVALELTCLWRSWFQSLNVTRNLDNKENVRGGFINDLSDISMAEEVAPKSASKSNHHRPDVLTSTPLSVQRQSIN